MLNRLILIQRWQNIRQFSSTTNLTLVNYQNGIKTITMNDPKTRNSLSLNMMQELIRNIENDQNDAKLRAIILSATGAIFSAGHNLKELADEHGRQQQENVFNLATNLMTTIIDCPVPVIAKIDGLAAAAGCQLVAQCDLAFCTTRSQFSTPGVNFGIFCSTPGIPLARTVRKTTVLKMLLTGQPIDSQQAFNSGLITGVSDNVDAEIAQICDAIKQKSRNILELGKRFYYKQIQYDIRTAYQLGAKQMVDNLQMDDGKEGICSFIEKRQPQWKN